MYLLDEQDKEELTDIWKSKDVDMSLSDFIKKYSKKVILKSKAKATIERKRPRSHSFG